MQALIPHRPGELIPGTVHLARVLQRVFVDKGKTRPVVIWRVRATGDVDIVGLTHNPCWLNGEPRTPIVHWALAGLDSEAWLWHHRTTLLPHANIGERVGILEPCDFAAIERLVP